MNKIDFLSPPITLFHLEKRTHTSNVGGFLLMLMTGLCVYYILFLFYDLMVHKKLTVLFHKRFEFEAGYYSFNSSSIFHFIQIFSPEDGGYFDKFNSKYIRAYTTYVHSNFSYSDLDLYDHWVFDTCSEGIDNKGLESYLFDNIENFTNGVCIRYYYNSSEKKYYNLGHEKFSWPYLEHGISQKKNIYLTTIVQKCSNDSIINQIFGQCPSQKDIDDYISKYFGIYLYFTDVQVDPANYTNPVQKYFQVISTGIGNSNNFVESYLHFSPLRVKTNIGTIFGTNYDIDSFCFDFNRKGSSDNNEKYFTITKYYHLMQNNVQIYERKYNNIFDILAEIGGLIQFIFYLFYWINYVYNKYIIAFDTNSLFFSVREEESNDSININKEIKFKNIKKINSDKSKNLKNKKYQNEKGKTMNNCDKNKSILGNEIKNDKENDINIIKQSKSNKKNDNYFAKYNSNNFLLLENNNIFIEKKNNLHNSVFNKRNNEKNKKTEVINKMRFSKKNLSNIIHKKEESTKSFDKSIKSIKYFSYIEFLKTILFKKEKESYNFIRIFRKHLLSEEHMFKTHIKVIFLEKQHTINVQEDVNILECYDEL